MKIPERLIGFVDYENTKFPFEFDEEKFTLNLYTPSIEVWNETSSIKNMFQRLEKDDKEHKWIGEIRLNGIASDGRKILFCLQDNRSNYHGFHSYPVNWYFYYSEQISVDALNGFSVEGEEIDYFFAPNQAIESALQFSKTKNNLEKITVTSNKQVTESCGKYRVIPHVDASIEVTCYATAHSNSYTNPTLSSCEKDRNGRGHRSGQPFQTKQQSSDYQPLSWAPPLPPSLQKEPKIHL